MLLHSALSRSEVIFGEELRGTPPRAGSAWSSCTPTSTGCSTWPTSTTIVPDLDERTTYACGPVGLLDALEEHHAARGLPLHIERFRTTVIATGEGGTVSFAKSGTVVEADGATPILDAAESAGVLMPSGCRMGICFGCVLPLREGAVRDLRNGELTTAAPGDGVTHPDLHQRRRRRLRHRPLTSPPARSPEKERPMTVIQKKPDEPDRPPHPRGHRADRRRARRDPPGRPRRPRRDRRGVHPQGRSTCSASSSSAAARCCSSAPSRPRGSSAPLGLSVAKILENMEIGHNILHGQWDWMRDPKIHSTTWEWDMRDAGRAVEALRTTSCTTPTRT